MLIYRTPAEATKGGPGSARLGDETIYTHIESESKARVQRLTDTVTQEIRSAFGDIDDLLPPSEESAEPSGDLMEEIAASEALEREDGVEETSAPGSGGTG